MKLEKPTQNFKDIGCRFKKPDWLDAPEWARYLAQDGDGEWWWFEFKPVPNHDISSWCRGSLEHRYEFAGSTCPPVGPMERRP